MIKGYVSASEIVAEYQLLLKDEQKDKTITIQFYEHDAVLSGPIAAYEKTKVLAQNVNRILEIFEESIFAFERVGIKTTKRRKDERNKKLLIFAITLNVINVALILLIYLSQPF